MRLYYYFVKKEKNEPFPHSPKHHHSPKPMREGVEHSRDDEAQNDSKTSTLFACTQTGGINMSPRLLSPYKQLPFSVSPLLTVLMPPTPITTDL